MEANEKILMEVSPELKDKIDKLLIAAGVDDVKAFKVLAEGLEAYKLIIDKYGDEHNEPDFNCRHKYVQTILELKGFIKQKTTISQGNNIQVNFNNVELSTKSPEELTDILLKRYVPRSS